MTAVARVEENFLALASMLRAHAHYEEERIHLLLKLKASSVHVSVEKAHAGQEEQLCLLKGMLDELLHYDKVDLQIQRSYEFYLRYRKFVADNLLHLHKEQTLLLPELQRLYSDEELRLLTNIQAGSKAKYRQKLPLPDAAWINKPKKESERVLKH